MIRKIAVAVFIVLAVVGALAGVKVAQIKTLIAAGKAAVAPAETVSSFVVREESWQNTLTAIGSISAVQGVTLTPDLPGTVREIAFDSGAVVAKDELLVKLDTSSEEAQLHAVEAQLELAKITVNRARTLRKGDTVSQSELDTAEATLKQTEANADTIRATIAKKTIRAPFAGRLGIRLVNLGQYLDAGKPIVSLQSLAPVYADFSLPQQELAQLKTGMAVRLTTDAYPSRQFAGKLTAINPDLDQATRSVGLQATFENAEQLLRPGMFARIEVLLPDHQKVLVIPATSVLSAPYGDSVYVIESKAAEGGGQQKNGTDGTNESKRGQDGGQAQLTVRQQFIRTGRARGDFISVEVGLKPGERVVSSGIFKLRNGMTVTENNDLAPKSTEAPKPSDS